MPKHGNSKVLVIVTTDSSKAIVIVVMMVRSDVGASSQVLCASRDETSPCNFHPSGGYGLVPLRVVRFPSLA